MKLETLKSLRNMAGLPPISESEVKCSFTFGDSTYQEEPDGRHSVYVETFCNGGHYSTVLYSDGKSEIHNGSGAEIDVNSLLGQKIVSAAREQFGEFEDVRESQEHTRISDYDSFLKDLQKQLNQNGKTTANVRLVKDNTVAYSFK